MTGFTTSRNLLNRSERECDSGHDRDDEAEFLVPNQPFAAKGESEQSRKYDVTLGKARRNSNR